MRVLVLGATGGTGRAVVERALELGHEVSAFMRRPEAFHLKHERLRGVKGDVLDRGSLDAVIPGHDAVFFVVGPRKGAQIGTTISTGAANVTAAMAAAGVRRLVHQSGMMVGEAKGLGAVPRLMLSAFRAMNRARYEDAVKAEATVRASPLEWTIVRPPLLADGPAKGPLRSGEDLDVSLTKAIAYRDLAQFLIETATNPASHRRTLEVSA